MMANFSTAIDPVILLKEHINQNKKIEKQGEFLVFADGMKLKLNTPTAFIQSSSEKKQYTLGSLWFYLKHRNDPLSVYKTELQRERIETVVGIDKGKILVNILDSIIDFFINDNSDVKIIDENLRQQTLIFLGKKKIGGENININVNSSQNTASINPLSSTDQNILNNEKSNPISTKKKKTFLNLEPELRIMDYIYTKQKHSLNRNSLLRPMGLNPISFESLLPMVKKTFTHNKRGNFKPSESLSFLDELSLIDDLKGNKAIIIVPEGRYPGNLNLENAKLFLLNSVYVDPTAVSTTSTPSCIFEKKIADKELSFEIHSNVRNFSRNDWKRVVAVFVQGSDWEFTEWPKSESQTSILQKIKGFHLKYSDLPTNDNVKKWNVKVLEVNRFKRHFDVSVQNEFWNILEQFLIQPRHRDKVIKNNN